ncbi:AAA family ATPase [Nitratireductor aquimarinus]|uniref:AAA family ATPase n=1 Tax=Nitratireductor aquimarinus TaxID=889300 RepID=UPI001A8E69F2|nr:AAA family ATPase [Nitratireductor aquimarinus]MBN8243280.1 AAA family ATPase [Nitratireductor aquimarinus]MBY6131181.1 AAA family ATPase [Nitratireductor aquimarinus]MCA1302063.1 AAA family ATPase [Nitratireductor aquimarinus]
MNEFLGTSQLKAATATNWERPRGTPDASLSNRTASDIEEWQTLIGRIIETATAMKLSKAEIARRIGMAEGTFSQWYSGKYAGRLDSQNLLVAKWLDAVAEAGDMTSGIPSSPPFIKTRTAFEIMETLTWAQATGDLVMITLNAGSGKTATCRHYCATRANVFMATMSPHTKTVHGMLVELASELDVQVHNPARLTRAIGKRLERAGGETLLIIDEAQNLVDDAINQLRHFADNHHCGIALVGNSEIYGRFAKRSDGPSYAQLKSRLGKRLKRDKPRQEDLQAFIEAWKVTDPDAVNLLVAIGMKGGAMRQIDKTMKLASMLSIGSGQTLSIDHIRAAWKNRDVEDMV